jgi:transglutaminase/protease-like cytokinesis protein 3
MKFLITTALLLISLCVLSAQYLWTPFDKIKDIRSSDPAELSAKITKAYTTDFEKVQAIYYWITHNLEYDYKHVVKMAEAGPDRTKYQPHEIQAKIDAEIDYALKRKRGICQNYAFLFEVLCEHAGIEAEFIGGWSKTGPGTNSGNLQTHAWNAVKLDDAWQLVDATYGAGYLDQERDFQYKFDPNFFCTDHALFLLGHYPKDETWQLTDTLLSLEVFETYPYVGSGLLEYGIKDLTPLAKDISITRSETLVIRFQSSKPVTNLVCRHTTTGQPVPMRVSNDDLNYTVQVAGSEFRSGYYVFLAGDVVLWSWKVGVR